MHVELPRKELFGLVRSITAISKTADIRPVLRNVLLTADKDGFSLTATDLTSSLWLNMEDTRIDVQIHKEGVALVSSKNLYSVINSIFSDTIELKTEGGFLSIQAGKALFKIVTEDHKDFPKISRFQPLKPFVTMPAKAIKHLISRVAYCAHTERSHFNMHGVVVKSDSTHIEMAATNGQRLSVARAPFSSYTAAEYKDSTHIIPASAIKLIDKVLNSGSAPTADLQWSRRGLNVRGDLGEISLIALHGKFPPYERGVPKNTKSVELDRRRLIQLLKQATALRGNASSFIEITLESGKMTIDASVQSAGQTKIETVGNWNHEPITIVLNPDFLVNAATAMEGDTVTLEIEDENTPSLVREATGATVDSFAVFAVARK